VKIRAPAKINFRLRRGGRRRDGYHLLDSVMAAVSLYDEVEIRETARSGKRSKQKCSRLQVTCDSARVPNGARNLAYKAASLLFREAGINKHVAIRIRKKIPVGAGLGGGSSDAAATLVGLNRLFRLGYSSRGLERLGLAVGADVPFFIRARPARARGVGERLTPLRRFPTVWLVLLYPGFPVATSWAFQNFSATLTKPRVNTSIAVSLGSFAKIPRLLINDLEPVVMSRFPKVALLKDSLRCQGATGVLMSGSGSAVFGVFKSRQKAQMAFRRLRTTEGIQAFVVHTLS